MSIHHVAETRQVLHGHLTDLADALVRFHAEVDRIDRWGRHLGTLLATGGRLLAAGNGGSAAHAQHLTAELVGRYRSERQPLSAIALHAETSALTAIVNDYGPDEAYARQVLAHGRSGDVLLCLSTSGRSSNVLRAVDAARRTGMTVWALTGPGPNPLAMAADDAVCATGATPTVQELHQAAVHLLCESLDAHLARRDPRHVVDLREAGA